MTQQNMLNSPLTADGQIMIGSSAGPPLPGTISAGTNITVTNSNNGISISASGGGGAAGVNLAYYTYFGGV